MEIINQILPVPAAIETGFIADEWADWRKQPTDSLAEENGLLREDPGEYAGISLGPADNEPSDDLEVQKRIATDLAGRIFPDNSLVLVATAPDISGGFHFSFTTVKEETGHPPLKPFITLPRAVTKLSGFTISFDPDQGRVKLGFERLGTPKSYSFAELDYQHGGRADVNQSFRFDHQGYQIERHYVSATQGTYSITDQQGQPVGEGAYDLAVPNDPEGNDTAARDNRPMPFLKSDAEIKKEVEDIIQQHRQQLNNTPQHVFAVHRETGDIQVIAQDAGQRPVLQAPEEAQGLHRHPEAPLLVIIPHKGFLSNFIINFKNQFDSPALEVVAAPASLPIEKAVDLIRENMPLIRAGSPDALTALKRKTGLLGLTDPIIRAFTRLPRERQQQVLGKLAADPEKNKLLPIQQKDGILQVPEEPLPRTTVLQDLKNFIALLNDQDPVYDQELESSASQPLALEDYITRLHMQDQKFDPDQINWKDAEKLGLTRELLESTGNMQRLLEGEKTTLFQGLKGDLGGVKISVDGKFRLVQAPGGYPTFVFHGVRSRLDIPKEFLGYQFSDEDKQHLQESGNLNKKVFLMDKASRQAFPAYVGVDREINEIMAIRAEKIRIPETIKGVTLSEEQKKLLEEGKPVVLAGMKDDKGQEFSATVQIDPVKKGFGFRSLPGTVVREVVKPEDKILTATKESDALKTTPADTPQQPEPEEKPGQEIKKGPKLS